MTSERAKELLNMKLTIMPGFSLISVGDIRKHMTSDEVCDVVALWSTMPGSTSFNDALNKIARG